MFWPLNENNSTPFTLAGGLLTGTGTIPRLTGMPNYTMVGSGGGNHYAQALVESEIVAFVISPSGDIQITNRALFGTTAVAHAAGTPVYFIHTPSQLNAYTADRNLPYYATSESFEKRGTLKIPYYEGTVTAATNIVYNSGTEAQTIGPIFPQFTRDLSTYTQTNFTSTNTTFINSHNYFYNMQSEGPVSSGDNIATLETNGLQGFRIRTKMLASWEPTVVTTRRSCGIFMSKGSRLICLGYDTSAGYARLSLVDYTNATTFASVLAGPFELSDTSFNFIQLRNEQISSVWYFTAYISADNNYWMLIARVAQPFIMQKIGYFINAAEANSPISMTLTHALVSS